MANIKVVNNSTASEAQLKAEIEKLKKENATLKGKPAPSTNGKKALTGGPALFYGVGPKGGITVYNVGRGLPIFCSSLCDVAADMDGLLGHMFATLEKNGMIVSEGVDLPGEAADRPLSVNDAAKVEAIQRVAANKDKVLAAAKALAKAVRGE